MADGGWMQPARLCTLKERELALYEAFYRRRSDGDGDLVAILTMPALENVDWEEFRSLENSIEGTLSLITDDWYFIVYSDTNEFPDTWKGSEFTAGG